MVVRGRRESEEMRDGVEGYWEFGGERVEMARLAKRLWERAGINRMGRGGGRDDVARG